MTKSRYEINQWDLNNKLQLFLEQQTFEDLLTDQIKTQSLPAYVDPGMCNGYDMMLLRANLIGETEQSFERLYLLNETSPQTIKKMGTLLETYKRDFARLSELEYKTWTSSIHKRVCRGYRGLKRGRGRTICYGGSTFHWSRFSRSAHHTQANLRYHEPVQSKLAQTTPENIKTAAAETPASPSIKSSRP